MPKLIKIEKITDDFIESFNLEQDDEMYSYDLNNTIVGYAIIRKRQIDKLFITILEDFQNNGYGKSLFKGIIDKIEDSVIFNVELENFKMQRIATENMAKEVGRNGKFIFYKIEK